MSIRKEDAYLHYLCMDLQEDGFKYAVLSKSDKSIVHARSLEFEAFNRDSITSVLSEPELFFDYESIVVSAGAMRNTIVPVDLFSHGDMQDIFKLNYPAPYENIDYNRIPELGIVNIYELPLWMKSMFVIKFPRAKIVHPSTVALKGVMGFNNWRLMAHVYVTSHSFYLLITEKDKLQYFNRFDYTNLADMVYHMLFVFEQKNLDKNLLELSLYGVPAGWELLAELQTYFKNPIKVSNKKEDAEYFILAKQLLCV